MFANLLCCALSLVQKVVKIILKYQVCYMTFQTKNFKRKKKIQHSQNSDIIAQTGNNLHRLGNIEFSGRRKKSSQKFR